MSAPRGSAMPNVRGRIGFLLCIGACLLLVSSADAQQVTPFGVELAAPGGTDLVSMDLACVRESFTVTNTGQSLIPQRHDITIGTTGPGAGWDVVEAPPTSMSLPPGEDTTVSFEICPSASVEDGAQASYRVTATVTSDPRNPPASAVLTFQLRATDDGLLGLDVPNTAVWLALAAVAALVTLVLLTRSRSGGGVSIRCPEASKTVAPGRGTSFPIRIRNEGRGKDVVSLSTTPVPPGWDTFLPLVDIPLEPREEQTVWLSVKSPDDARSGDHLVVKVTARSSATAGEQATIDTLTTVRAAAADPGPSAGEESVYIEDEEEGGDDAEPRPVAVKRRKK